MRTRATFRSKASSRKLTRRASTLSILSVAAALVVTNLTPVVVTSASWADEEWVHGQVGTLSCSDDGSDFKTRGAGRLLGGEVLSTDLDSVVALKGMTVTNDGENSHAAPNIEATSPDIYQNSLDVNVLSKIEFPVVEGVADNMLNSVLALTPAPESGAGVVNQYARASDTGLSEGASGVVSDSGVILSPESENLPGLGTIKVSTLVQNLTGQAISSVVAGITDLQLEIGAVASRATLDACDAAWTDDIDSSLTREYAIAGLDAEIEAPDLIGKLTGQVPGLLSGLETAVDALAADSGVLSSITSGVGTLLNGLLGEVLLGGKPTVTLALDVDLNSLGDLLTTPISDKAGTVVLDLTSGEVSIDLASLLGAAYGGHGFHGDQGLGLNGLSPNVELVLNAQVANALVAALGEALDGWVGRIVAAVKTAVNAAYVEVTVAVDLAALTLIKIASIKVSAKGTLDDLLHGRDVTSAEVKLLGVGCLPLVGGLACLVDGIASGLVGGLGELVGGVLRTTILGQEGVTPNNSLVGTLGSTLSAATAPVITALSTVLVRFLGVDGLVSLRVNVQNDPAAGDASDPDPPLTYPEWEIGTRAVPDDQYDVAALSVSLLDATGAAGNINLELARSSVGANCWIWDSDDRCPGY